MLITIIPKIGKTMGGFQNPPTMELSTLAMLEHHKLPGLCSNIAVFFYSTVALRYLVRQTKKTHFHDNKDDDNNAPSHHDCVAPLLAPPPLSPSPW
jgi:hypothetical protein